MIASESFGVPAVSGEAVEEAEADAVGERLGEAEALGLAVAAVAVPRTDTVSVGTSGSSLSTLMLARRSPPLSESCGC